MNIKSKFKIPKPAIISLMAVLGLIIPAITKAGLLDDAAKALFGTLGEIVKFCLNGLFSMSASLFEGALGMGFDNGTAEIIKTGWTACRDFTNILFILFMVIIAFATILRTEQYGIKKLLPKIIGIALLINFSFVLCSVFVDFSNITADFFIKDIKGKISTQSGETEGLITGQFADAFNITGVYVTITDCDQMLKAGTSYCNSYYTNVIVGPSWLDLCLQGLNKKYNECKKDGGILTKTDDSTFLDIFLGYTIGSIVMIVAIFTLSAGALMILFRIIAIWFLIAIVPLAFICYALPGLQDNWKKWWTKFLHWCIFAPLYAFFIWMAISISIAQANKKMGMLASQYTMSENYNATANAFQNNPGGELISYLIIIGFLMGALVVAQTLSIYGANAAMKIATNAKNGATNWAKRRATRPLEAGGKIAGAGALGLGARLFKGTKWGGRMDAKATQISQSRTQTKENKTYENLTKTMTDDALLKEIESAISPRKLIATQTAMGRGLLAKTSNKDAINKAAKTLEGYGMKKEANDLRETRIDSELDPTKLENKIKEMRTKEELGNMSPKALEDPRIIQLLTRLCSIGELDTLRNKSGRHGAALKTGLTVAANNPANTGNAQIQHAYASQTGDIETIRTRGHLATYAATAGVDAFRKDRVSYDKIIASGGSMADIVEDLAHNIPPGALSETLRKADPKLAAGVVAIIKNILPVGHPNKAVVNGDKWLDSLA